MSEKRWATCRVCKKQEPEYQDGLVNLWKYGVRHYAHADCGLTKWGLDFINKFSSWQLESFPAPVAARFSFSTSTGATFTALDKILDRIRTSGERTR